MKIRLFLVITLWIALGSGLFWVSINDGEDATGDDFVVPSPVPREEAELPEFEVTALQIDDGKRHIITCRKQKCATLRGQKSDEYPAVTDGDSWYFYREVEDERGEDKVQIVRSRIDSGKTDLIIEQTDLVKPRGLYISPDNEKVAFWMDNIARGSDGLTELWVYDSKDDGTKLVAENIQIDGVLTRPRWNRASSQVFFLGETGRGKSEVHVVSIHDRKSNLPFAEKDWSNRRNLVQSGVMDTGRDGGVLAYAEDAFLGRSYIKIVDGEEVAKSMVRGRVPYLHWIKEDTLLYVLQDSHTFSFWELKNGTHKYLARYQGSFKSARGDSRGRYLVFSVRHEGYGDITLALDVEERVIEMQGRLPRISGNSYVIDFKIKDDSRVAGSIKKVDEEVIARFIEEKLSDIVTEQAEPQRLVMTDRKNTVFVDYLNVAGERGRVLVMVKDAIHAEWSVIARYEERRGGWVLKEGGGFSEPEPVKVYEWEESLGQWVLKEEYGE